MATNNFRLRNKTFILTYSSDYLNQISVDIIYNEFQRQWRQEHDHDKCKFNFVIAKEHGDSEIEHDHFHVFCDWAERGCPNIRRKDVFDIKLDKPVVAFGKKDGSNTHLIGYKFLDEEENMEKTGNELGADSIKIITHAHPNIKVKKYGKISDMIKYVTKQQWEIKSNFNYEERINEELVSKKKKHENEPDWQYMKNEGMTARQAMDYLMEHHLVEFMNNWSKWEGPFYLTFAPRKDDWNIDLDKVFYIPIEVYNWYNTYVKPYFEHMYDEEWLKKNRQNRPKSLIWIGGTKCGKTTFMRGCVPNNYYQFLIDGFNDFSDSRPLTILDDFHYDFKKYMPNWRCWFGCQTSFTVNPKYGKRRRINWGHPVAILSNKNFLDPNITTFDSEELDYIEHNCVVVNTGNRKLWREEERSRRGLFTTTKKITLRELRPDLSGEECEELNASEADREIQENSTILIEDDEIPAANSMPRQEKRVVEWIADFIRESYKKKRTD